MNNDDDLLAAVEKIADTSFKIAERPSGSEVKGFYRPGERPMDGDPFEVIPTKCPQYTGAPTGRAPTEDEKRGAWQLQEEYLAGRLGGNAEENDRLWNTAKWIDKQIRIATMPANATKSMNLYAGNWKEDVNPEEIRGSEEGAPSFGVELLGVSARDMERIKVLADAFDLVSLMDELDGFDKSKKIDSDKLLRDAGPRAARVDFPTPDEREEAGKIVRTLVVGMRSLWTPVKLAIVDHATMKQLGKAQGVGDGVAAAVGRQRVIDGLRIAESIRRGLARQERRLDVRPSIPSPDWIITEVLTALSAPHVAANDNCRSDAIGKVA